MLPSVTIRCTSDDHATVDGRDPADRDPEALVLRDSPDATELLDGLDAAADGIDEDTVERALFGLELDLNGARQRWLRLLEFDEPR